MISVIAPVEEFLLTVLTVLSDLNGPEKVELAICVSVSVNAVRDFVYCTSPR